MEIIAEVGSMNEFPTLYEQLYATENLEIHLAYLQKDANASDIIKKVSLTEVGKSRFLNILSVCGSVRE